LLRRNVAGEEQGAMEKVEHFEEDIEDSSEEILPNGFSVVEGVE
jgi:hypothetical protein